MEELVRSSLLCVFGTEGSRGPHLVPIWFLYGDRCFHMVTGEDRRKLENLKRSPRAGLVVVADGGSPAVMVDGVAETTPDGAGELVCELARRYLGETQAKRYIDELFAVRPAERLRHIVLRPTWWKSWGVE
jgi:nitroimidazol reductase NimA-like FMN-containing flavoprotein (pyridoxamine 5'-phosphate oxidase superfamily)